MNKENLKTNKVDAPTMFIGVGGTGCEVVKKVFDYCGNDEKEDISFVCMDTNVNDLRRITEDNKGITIVQTSNTQTVGSYLDIDKDAAKNWFPKNAVIFDKTVSEGAGQLRAISRLAFNSTIKTGNIAPLCTAIDDLFKKNGEKMKQALRVCVVSTASGGTGSGMMLPLCMFVRDYVNNKYPNASVILRTLVLLPETLDKVIKSNVEKDSQRRNAYATIKELNAFMMKGSGFCDIEEELKRYKNLHIDITDPGRKELKKLSLLPCDFCFLIDGQDAEDATSSNVDQYKDQAALALYEQNIGPMQKKTYSVEDNIIKELSNPGNYGRNRFGGIGAGRLKYPYEKIVEYISLNWAKESIGGKDEQAKWRKYDNIVALKRKDEKNRGLTSDERTKKEQAYIEALFNDEANDFSKELINQYDLRSVDERIKLFSTKLKNKVTEAVEESNKIRNAKGEIPELSKEFYKNISEWGSADDHYGKLSDYFRVIGTDAKRIANSTIDSILQSDKKTLKLAEQEYCVEYLIKTGDGHFCHPNAARYVLYKLYLDVAGNVNGNKVGTASNEVEKYFNGEYKFKFKDGSQFDSLEKLCNAVKSLNTKNKKDVKTGLTYVGELGGSMASLYDAIETYKETIIDQTIYAALSEYVGRLNKEYEDFFDEFEKKCASVEISQRNIVDALKYNKGDSCRYVCAEKEMMEELTKWTENQMKDGMLLDDELNSNIFDSIRKNAKFEKDRQINPEIVWKEKKLDIFDDSLLKYFKEAVDRKCEKILDINIIQAISRERELKRRIALRRRSDSKDIKNEEEKDSRKEDIAYIKAVIENGEKISAPGIQRIVGEEPREINVSAYNNALTEMNDYKMSDLLPNGVAGDTVSKYEIHFFNALYNLTPDKLKKFAAPKVTDTGVRAAGLYHNAYTVYTRDIGPDCLKSSKMTTHIDRRWDSIAAMPELDIEYQQKQFLRTHKALVYGLVFQRIQQKVPYLDNNVKIEKAAKAYRYLNTHNHVEDMVVSNGTICDEFYEVLDSLYIDRALVEDIYEYESRETAKDLIKHSSYAETTFKKYVDSFNLVEYSIPGRKTSLFEIPVMFYGSIPSKQNNEAEINSLVDAVIDVFRCQIEKYEPEKNSKFLLCNVLEEQYELLIDNYEAGSFISNKVSKSENKVLEIIERKVQEIMEASPQPDEYEKTVENMKDRLIN